MEQFIWKQEIESREKELDDFMRGKDKIRHARYYKKNRKKILSKQKKNYRLCDRKMYSKEYYEKNKDEILKKHRQNYRDKKEERLEYQRRYWLEHKEEIKEKRRLKRLEKQEGECV